LADKVSNMFSKRGNDNENKTFDPNSLDYSTPVSDNLNNIAGNTKEIADNTAEIGEEDLKYLIDMFVAKKKNGKVSFNDEEKFLELIYTTHTIFWQNMTFFTKQV